MGFSLSSSTAPNRKFTHAHNCFRKYAGISKSSPRLPRQRFLRKRSRCRSNEVAIKMAYRNLRHASLHITAEEAQRLENWLSNVDDQPPVDSSRSPEAVQGLLVQEPLSTPASRSTSLDYDSTLVDASSFDSSSSQDSNAPTLFEEPYAELAKVWPFRIHFFDPTQDYFNDSESDYDFEPGAPPPRAFRAWLARWFSGMDPNEVEHRVCSAVLLTIVAFVWVVGCRDFLARLHSPMFER